MELPRQRDDAPAVGQSVDNIIEAGAGGIYHRAVILAELASATYAAVEEFAYDKERPADGLVQLCRLIEQHLEVLSITPEGRLTINRECSRCGGKGKTSREDPCVVCLGAGYLIPEDDDPVSSDETTPND